MRLLLCLWFSAKHSSQKKRKYSKSLTEIIEKADKNRLTLAFESHNKSVCFVCMCFIHFNIYLCVFTWCFILLYVLQRTIDSIVFSPTSVSFYQWTPLTSLYIVHFIHLTQCFITAPDRLLLICLIFPLSFLFFLAIVFKDSFLLLAFSFCFFASCYFFES